MANPQIKLRMNRIDISRLRKEHGMSQNELASRLQITQSFLSAIENGKSPLPVEKEEKLHEIFNHTDLNLYIIDRKEETAAKKLGEMTDSDLFNQLLSRFHKQAHSEETEHHHHDHHQQIDDLERKLEEMAHRNDALMDRNDRLSTSNDKLREEIDNYRVEIQRLREEIFNLKNRLLEMGERV